MAQGPTAADYGARRRGAIANPATSASNSILGINISFTLVQLAIIAASTVLFIKFARMDALNSFFVMIFYRLLAFIAYYLPSQVVFAADEVLTHTKRPAYIDEPDTVTPDVIYQAKVEAVRRLARSLLGLPPAYNAKNSYVTHGNPVTGHGLDSGARNHKSSKQLSLEPEPKPVKSLKMGLPIGLGNSDNACFQNSVIQGLSSLPSLTQFLDGTLQRSVDTSEEMPVTDSLMEMIRTLNLSRFEDPGTLWMDNRLKVMASLRQEDAQEYLSALTDSVEKETKGIVSQALNERKSTSFVNFKLKSSFPFLESYKINVNLEKSSLVNPFEGLIAERTQCTKCGYSEGVNFQPFTCLVLRPKPETPASVHDLLRDFVSSEELSGVDCKKCAVLMAKEMLEPFVEPTLDDPPTPVVAMQQQMDVLNETLDNDDYSDSTLGQKCNINPKSRVLRQKLRQTCIGRAPQSLIVNISRTIFNGYDMEKNTAPVELSPWLELGPYCFGNQSWTMPHINEEQFQQLRIDNTNNLVAGHEHDILPVYQLRGVVTHSGRHDAGHYICFRLHPVSLGSTPNAENFDVQQRSMWWEFDDNDVYPISASEVMNLKNAFMLFYERVPDSEIANQVIEPETYYALAGQYARDNDARKPVRLDIERDMRRKKPRQHLGSRYGQPDKTWEMDYPFSDYEVDSGYVSPNETQMERRKRKLAAKAKRKAEGPFHETIDWSANTEDTTQDVTAAPDTDSNW